MGPVNTCKVKGIVYGDKSTENLKPLSIVLLLTGVVTAFSGLCGCTSDLTNFMIYHKAP